MFRLKESFAYAKDNGILGKQKKTDIARVLWPESSARSAYVNFRNLESGKSKKVDIENVEKICDLFGVTLDFLFGLSDIPTKSNIKTELKEKAKELNEIIDKI